MRPLYLDHNAGAPLDPAAREAMLAHLDAANPSSVHRFGRRARQALEDARETVAHLLQAHPDEVVFTSGATEANNLAIRGLAGEPGVLLHSGIEHPSVLEPLEHLEKHGFLVVPLSPVADAPGSVRLVCVQLANHETGAILPVAGHAARWPVHCDATQAVGKMPVSFRDLGAVSLSFSAHKFGGPRGVGCLIVKRGVKLVPLTYGGHQQGGRRPGTEPVALIAALAAALRACVERMQEHREKMIHLRRILWEGIQPAVLNSPEDGLPHVLNVSFPGLASDALLIALDLAGVACSAGAACSSGSLLPSPVLRFMGLPEERLRSALRLSLGWEQAPEEVADAAARISSCVRRLRSLGDRPAATD
ncbi:MAG: cysteine desulfurase [Gemmataceae bacterium]|nr:cysteine desulfurase [Gemmataceae bacterium]